MSVWVVRREACCVARFMPSDIAVAICAILVLRLVRLILSGLGGGVGCGSVCVV